MIEFFLEKGGDFDLAGSDYLEHEQISEDTRSQLYFLFVQASDKLLFPHWHEHLELVYVTEGEMTAYSQDKAYELKAGDLFLINTSEIHYTHTHLNTKYCLLQIPPVHLKRITPAWETLQFREYFAHEEDSDSLNARLGRIFLEMKQLDEEKKEGYQLLMLSAVCRLLYLLAAEAQEKPGKKRLGAVGREAERMKQTMEYIRRHYREPLTLSDGAALLSVTPEHFCRLFRRYTGQTFLNYLGQVRMTHFYEDLLENDDSITLLLDRHGIRNYKVFLREFKETYGRTPQQIRKENRENHERAE